MGLSVDYFERSSQFFSLEQLEKAIKIVSKIISKVEGYIIFDSKLGDFFNYDKCTYLHSENVCLLTVLIAKEMGYSGKGLEEIALGAILHDVGKLMIPKDILDKPSSLTKEEYDLVKRHPEMGMRMMERLFSNDNILMPILQHHECKGGTGYPSGLHANDIHPNAKIVAVADVFDALTSDRPYRRGLPLLQALEIINADMRNNLSQEIVDVLLELLDKRGYN